MNKYGETYYATEAGDFPAQAWGTSTRKGEKLFIHVFDNDVDEILLPMTSKVKRAVAFDSREKVKYTVTPKGVVLTLPSRDKDTIDFIVELTTV